MVVLDRASVELEHAEGSPFATLREPLPPGEVVDMSIAYLMPHHGTLALRWTSPLPVANGPRRRAAGAQAQEGRDRPGDAAALAGRLGPSDFELYELGRDPVGGSFDLEVEGLVTRPRTFRASASPSAWRSASAR
jgi:hypothetical protein